MNGNTKDGTTESLAACSSALSDLLCVPFLGLSENPPSSPWGINFGGGLNSTALIIEARNRGLKPDWILFADTGSEIPGTLEHVELMREWCKGWAELTIVRWIRVNGEMAGKFEPIHENCLRTNWMPSKAYGYAGCTMKWKVQPMDKWRKQHGFQRGAYAVGYDAGETRRINAAKRRGDSEFVAWMPLAAWGIDRDGCKAITDAAGIEVGKSSCFCCPNMRLLEWEWLKKNHNEQYQIALEIERKALAAGNANNGGLIRRNLAEAMGEDDRCSYCYT